MVRACTFQNIALFKGMTVLDSLLVGRRGEGAVAAERIARLRDEHAKKPSLVERLRKAGLVTSPKQVELIPSTVPARRRARSLADGAESSRERSGARISARITLDALDRVFVADPNNDRIRVFTQSGYCLGSIGSGHGTGTESPPSPTRSRSRRAGRPTSPTRPPTSCS